MSKTQFIKFLLTVILAFLFLISLIYLIYTGSYYQWAMQDQTVTAKDAIAGANGLYILLILFYVVFLVIFFVDVKSNIVAILMLRKASIKKLELFVEPENIQVSPKFDLHLIEIKDDPLFQNAIQAKQHFVGITKKNILIKFKSNFITGLTYLILIVGFFTSLTIRNLGVSIVMIILFFAVSVIFNKSKFKGQKRQNLKLLILRVFGIDQTAKFTFTKLVNYWKHFGTYFTIVDPTFYRIMLRRKYNSKMIIRISCVMLFYMAIYSLLKQEMIKFPNSKEEILLQRFTVSYLALLLLIAVLNLVYVFFRIRKTFFGSTKNFQEHIERQLERPLGMMTNAFKSVPVMCFDNTWKRSIFRLSSVADVVLMDLRGYSEKNKGCEYEVDFLFDTILSNKIVFLANQNSASEIKEMIIQKWAKVSETSPNLSNPKPTAQLYITNRGTEQDIQFILDSLLFAAECKKNS